MIFFNEDKGFMIFVKTLGTNVRLFGKHVCL